ncbi:hypothetical protein F5876DRAFT_71364, partial [Lentinula aff. lateritia]
LRFLWIRGGEMGIGGDGGLGDWGVGERGELGGIGETLEGEGFRLRGSIKHWNWRVAQMSLRYVMAGGQRVLLAVFLSVGIACLLCFCTRLVEMSWGWAKVKVKVKETGKGVEGERQGAEVWVKYRRSTGEVWRSIGEV